MSFFNTGSTSILVQPEKQLALDAARFQKSRNRIAHNLSQYNTDIKLVWSQFGPDQNEFNQMQKELSAQIPKVEDLLGVAALAPLGDRTYNCAEKRQLAILNCLRYVTNLTWRCGPRWDAGMALEIISKRIGGIRLIGPLDETADEMDRQARVLWEHCSGNKDNFSSGSLKYFECGELDYRVPDMYSVDSYCGCPWCRG
jgi:hypothetical protein